MTAVATSETSGGKADAPQPCWRGRAWASRRSAESPCIARRSGLPDGLVASWSRHSDRALVRHRRSGGDRHYARGCDPGLKYGVRRALLVAVVGLIVSLAVAGPPVYLWRQAESLPHIHDISTDTDNPPQYVAVVPLRKDARNPTDYSAETAAQQKKGYPDIAPALLDVPPSQALRLAERAARAMGWDIVAVAPDDLRIEATDTTLLFGFKDDIVIRVTANGSGSRVDARSLSRIGGSDIGTNARRIRSFMRQLEAAKAAG